MSARIFIPLALIAGIGIGYWLGDRNREDTAPNRTARTARDVLRTRGGGSDAAEQASAGRTAEGAPAKTTPDPEPAQAKPQATEEKSDGFAALGKFLAASSGEKDGAQDDEMAENFGKLMTTMRPFWEADEQKKVAALAADLAQKLGLDEERARILAEVMQAQKKKEIDEFFTLFSKQGDIDVEKIWQIEEQKGLLSKESAEALSRHLSQNQMESLNGELQQRKRQEKNAELDTKINGLGIPELNEHQRQELRAIWREDEEDPDNVQMWMDLFKGDQTFESDAVQHRLDDVLARRRERVRGLLNDEQYEKYLASEEAQRQLAKASMEFAINLSGGKKNAGPK